MIEEKTLGELPGGRQNPPDLEAPQKWVDEQITDKMRKYKEAATHIEGEWQFEIWFSSSAGAPPGSEMRRLVEEAAEAAGARVVWP